MAGLSVSAGALEAEGGGALNFRLDMTTSVFSTFQMPRPFKAVPPVVVTPPPPPSLQGYFRCYSITMILLLL